MKPIRTTLALLTMPLLMSCQSDVMTPQEPATDVSATACKVPTHPVHFSATVVDGDNKGTATRATLTAEKHYAYAAGDMLYVRGTGENADKVYGALPLSTSDFGKTSVVVFEGDLQVADGFEPTNDMPLEAVLVGADDRLYTFGEGEDEEKIVSMAYPQADAIVPTVAEAVERYSHMTAESTYGERRFSLTQNTCFVNFTVTLADGTEAGAEVGVYIFTDDNELPTDLRTGTVTTVADGDAVKARFTAAFPGGTELDGAVIGLGVRTPIAFGGTTTLAANKIYNVNKTFERIAGSAAYTYDALKRSNPDNAIRATDNPLTIVGDGTATYSSSNTAVASVVESGEGAGTVTIVGPGEATITATIADGTNYTYADNNTASYTLTVKDPVALADVTADEHIGWVIGSDGHAYVTATGVSANSPTEVPVAMIGYIGDAGTAETGETYRGLAVALTDVYLEQGETTVWSSGQGTCTAVVSNFSGAKTVSNGIAMTSTLVGCGTHIHQAASMAQAYDIDGFTPSENGCSAWFLPSTGQWFKVFKACGVATDGWTAQGYCPDSDGNTIYDDPPSDHNCADNYTAVQTLMSAVGNPFSANYWTCSDYGNRHAWSVGFDSESGVKMEISYKTNTRGVVFNVRPFIAF